MDSQQTNHILNCSIMVMMKANVWNEEMWNMTDNENDQWNNEIVRKTEIENDSSDQREWLKWQQLLSWCGPMKWQQ